MSTPSRTSSSCCRTRILLAGTQLLLHCAAEHPKASLRASVPHDGKSRIDANQWKGAKLKPTCIIDVHGHFFNLFHLVSNAVFVKLLAVRILQYYMEKRDMRCLYRLLKCARLKLAFKKARLRGSFLTSFQLHWRMPTSRHREFLQGLRVALPCATARPSPALSRPPPSCRGVPSLPR